MKWSFSDKKQENRMDVKCNGSGGGGSEGEEGYIFQSPLDANGVNTRKRIKLQGKVGCLLAFFCFFIEILMFFLK